MSDPNPIAILFELALALATIAIIGGILLYILFRIFT